MFCLVQIHQGFGETATTIFLRWRQWFPVKKHQQISATAHNLRTSGMLQQQLLSEFMFGGICSYISFIHVLRVSYNFGSCV